MAEIAVRRPLFPPAFRQSEVRYPTPSRIKYENKEHQKGKVYTH